MTTTIHAEPTRVSVASGAVQQPATPAELFSRLGLEPWQLEDGSYLPSWLVGMLEGNRIIDGEAVAGRVLWGGVPVLPQLLGVLGISHIATDAEIRDSSVLRPRAGQSLDGRTWKAVDCGEIEAELLAAAGEGAVGFLLLGPDGQRIPVAISEDGTRAAY